jgi:hypothetical protein
MRSTTAVRPSTSVRDSVSNVELLGFDLADVCELAARVEPYVRQTAAGSGASCSLSGCSSPRCNGRRRGGYIDRRQIPAADV